MIESVISSHTFAKRRIMIRTRPALTATLLAAAFAALVFAVFASPGGAAAQAGVCPANPSPVDEADPSIVVESPVDGAEVSSPIAVEGLARTFEANVRYTLFAADGAVLADGFTTAEYAAPELAPFATTVSYELDEPGAGCLRVFEESAADGSPVNVVQVELQLGATAPEATPTGTPAPPATGTGGSLGTPDGLSMLFLALGAAVALLIASTVAAAAPYRRNRR
jgi:hypothetical protein